MKSWDSNHARFVSQAGGGSVAKNRRYNDLRDGYLPKGLMDRY
jgi:hypothetical protein